MTPSGLLKELPREPGLESPAKGPKEEPKGKGTKERGPYSLMDHQ